MINNQIKENENNEGEIDMGFKILLYRSGKEYPSEYSDGKPELFIKRVKDLELKYNVYLPKIKEVFIGDNEYPINEIHFEDGLKLYDEEASLYPGVKSENKERLENWLATKRNGGFSGDN